MNGKYDERNRTGRSEMAKKVRRKSIRQPFQVPQRHAAVDDETLALMKHRRVGGVMVGAVGAAGDDDADRRLLRQHGADLARRGVGAQHLRRVAAAAGGQIEGVMVGARRVMRGDVQRAEVEPVAFDIGAIDHAAAHGAEDRGDFLHGAGDGVDQAGLARARRQGWIDAFGQQAGVESGVLELDFPRFDRRGQGVFQPIKRGAAVLALFGRRLAEVAQHPGQAAVAAEHGDADGVPGAQVGGIDERRVGGGLQGLQIVIHRSVPYTAKGRPGQAALCLIAVPETGQS